MSEHGPSFNNPEQVSPFSQSEYPANEEERREPTPEELAEFHAWREQYAYRPELRIEDFAAAPDNPTEWEISAVEEINKNRYLSFASYQRYFGHLPPMDIDPFLRLKEDVVEFEKRYQYWRHPLDIDDFVQDPINPTEEELNQWEEACAEARRRKRMRKPDFEKLFGYPDPREVNAENQATDRDESS